MEFAEIQRLPLGPARTAALVAWFQSLYPPDEDPAVLVGGAAVELFTGGAHTTGDLDFVGRIPGGVSERLRNAGFERGGRHWVHREAGVWIEVPGTHVGADERVVELDLEGSMLRVISPEDLIVDRLAAWKFWKSEIDGVNAYRLWQAQAHALDPDRLEQRAGKEHVSDALAALQAFAARDRGMGLDDEEIARWARRED